MTTFSFETSIARKERWSVTKELNGSFPKKGPVVLYPPPNKLYLPIPKLAAESKLPIKEGKVGWP